MANTKTFLSLFFVLGLSGCGNDEPGALCGGLGAFRCGDTEFCDYPAEARCGEGDQSGTCEPRPVACEYSVQRVRGANGQVYDNPCLAHADGVDD